VAKIGINIATGSLQQPEMIVGIDLGTTNSLVAIIHPESKKPVALKEHNSSSLVPSIVHFDAFGNVTVGEAAKTFLESDPANTIFSAKRLMVDADVRGQGIGTTLVQFAENRILKISPNVFICVSSFNQKAQQLYFKLGYEQVGLLKNFIADGFDELLLRKTTGTLNGFIHSTGS